MSSRRDGRKKCNEPRNKKTLYEKHIPYISEAIASIIDKSRNNEFKIRCQELLQVNGSNEIQEALSSKLFMLTLGESYDLKSSSHIQEDCNLQAASSSTNTSFGDLADHLENDGDGQWSFLDEPSLENRTRAKIHQTNNFQDDISQLQPKKHFIQESNMVEPRENVSTYMVLDTAADITSDDNFKSLECDMMFREFRLCDGITDSHDQQVPCYNQSRIDGSIIYTNSQPVTTTQRGPTMQAMVYPGTDDHNFETLGNFVSY